MESNDVKNKIRATITQSAFWMVNKKTAYLFGHNSALFLSELIAKDALFEKKDDAYDGWFFYEKKKMEETLFLSYHKQSECIAELSKFGIIETKRMGTPSKTFYKINYILYNVFLGLDFSSAPKFSRGQEFEKFKLLILKNLKSNYYYTTYNNYNNKNIICGALEIAPQSDTLEKYKMIAQKLKQIVTNKSKKKISNKIITNWADTIRKLCTIDGVSEERVQTALDWYQIHHADDYVPVIESGKTLREKFTRLEAAIERDKNNAVKRTRKTGYQSGETLTYKKPIQI